MDSAQLREMFWKKSADGEYEAWMRAFCKRKYNSDFAREMSRSVAEYLKQYDQQ
jgi:nitroreductase/FMN reductase (NADPH)/FMN reductase [NAD(P)H]